MIGNVSRRKDSVLWDSWVGWTVTSSLELVWKSLSIHCYEMERSGYFDSILILWLSNRVLRTSHLTSLSHFFIYILDKKNNNNNQNQNSPLCLTIIFWDSIEIMCVEHFPGCGELCHCEVWMLLSSLMESSLRVYTFHKPPPAAYFIFRTLLLWLFLLFVLITSRRKPPLGINEL